MDNVDDNVATTTTSTSKFENVRSPKSLNQQTTNRKRIFHENNSSPSSSLSSSSSSPSSSSPKLTTLDANNLTFITNHNHPIVTIHNEFNNNNLDASNNSSDLGSSDAANADYNNMNEPRYCYCDSVSYGEMIFCENKEVTSIIIIDYMNKSYIFFNLQCPYQWFHYECVGIKVPPDGSWFCPTCLKDVKERYRKDTIAN